MSADNFMLTRCAGERSVTIAFGDALSESSGSFKRLSPRVAS
jgi:hypothetical protein